MLSHEDFVMVVLNGFWQFFQLLVLVLQEWWQSLGGIAFRVGDLDNGFDVSLQHILIGFLIIDFTFFIFFRRSLGRE